jgi:chromosome segregation ATPase
MDLQDESNVYYTELGEEEPGDLLFNNSKQVENNEHQIIGEVQQPLYKLQNIDTEALIKSEIKQLIFTKVSEEANAKILNEMAYEIEEQITNLRAKNDELLNKNQELNKEVEVDYNRLIQSEELLVKTDEMIGLLKENVEKLEKQYRESRISDLLEKSKKQYESLELLKISFEPKLDQAKENFESTVSVSDEHNKTLKSELDNRQDVLEDLKKKQEEFKRVVVCYDDDIANNLVKKHLLKEKIVEVTNKKINIKNEITEQDDKLHSLCLKTENQIHKFNDVKEQKEKLEKQLEEAAYELNDLQTHLTNKSNDISNRECCLNGLRDQLEIVKTTFQESVKTLQQKCRATATKLNEILAEVSSCKKNNDQLLTKLSSLKIKYHQECEEKLLFLNKTITHQHAVYTVKISLLKKQMENEIKRAKLEEIQGQYEISVDSLNSLINSIIKEKEKLGNELTEVKLKFERTQLDYNKSSVEVKKKKEYLLANSKFLKEKSENLQQEVNEAEELYKRFQEETLSLKLLVENKSLYLNEGKNKIATLKRNFEGLLKSGFRSPNKENINKKVKFNEILSFKSPTSSETSNLHAGNSAQLETSFHEWLLEAENESSDLLNEIEKPI